MEVLTSLVDQAWTALQHNRLDEAKTHATQAFTQAPDSADAAHVLGVIANRDGRADLALPLLQKAIAAGVTERRLRDMGEALLLAKHPQAALAPVQDAIRQFGESSDSLGLLAAIYAALENFDAASEAASRALALNPESLTWQTTISFAELIQCRFKQGLPGFSFRNQTLQEHARCPVLQFAQPGELWLRNEQGPGDTLFFLCFAPALRARGWRLHVQTHAKMQKVLEQSGLFESVELAFTCPPHGFWINIGDLPLAAMQLDIAVPQAPLPFTADEKLVAKLRKILEKFGPAPYVAVTWRGGVQGKKLRNGVRMGDREIDPTKLGQMLANTAATIISVQRVPEQKEAAAFERALGRKYLNLSRLNDNLPEMLALMAIVDEYIAVPNTNHHLREALGRPSKILVNRPYEDWRWVVTGNSPWYPQAACYRQAINGDISNALQAIAEDLNTHLATLPALSETGQQPQTMQQTLAPAVESEEDEHAATIQTLLAEGWAAVRENQFTNAIQLAQKVLALQAEHAGAFHLLGWTAMRDMKFELAVSLLQKALSLSPFDGRIVGDLMRALAVNGQNELACQIAAGALKDPNMRVLSAIYYARAASYLHQNRIAEAIEDYQQCMQINPNRLDAPEFSGMSRLKLGDARQGFREFSARSVAQRPELLNDWCCPVLTPAHRGTRILIKRDMGLGDELSYLRYMPWLAQAGMVVDYWCGKKLKPILERTGLFNRVIADSVAPPDAAEYDLSFIVNEVPLATERLGAPEIAPPLPLTPNPTLVSKWQHWLAEQGPGPYIGLNWRAGLGVQGSVNIFAKLAKSVDATAFAQALSGIGATFISLQRNVMSDDVHQFEQALGAPLHDAAGLTDDLDDLLALLSLLDENIGVSNTNMHLRAGLNKGSQVFVQFADGDWRWGLEGEQSPWFAQSRVYRQSADRSWDAALQDMRQILLTRYSEHIVLAGNSVADNAVPPPVHALTRKIIWVTAGEINTQGATPVSELESTNQRVIAPAMGLETMGWKSVFLNEMMAEVMGGWCGQTPQAGDVVVISKVITPHALHMMQDARQRGAYVVLDVFNDFSHQPKRAAYQQQLIQQAQAIVSIAELKSHWQSLQVHIHAMIESMRAQASSTQQTAEIEKWHALLSRLPDVVEAVEIGPASTARPQPEPALPTLEASIPSLANPLPVTPRRIIWVTAGELDSSLGYATSVMASTRYRVLLPAANLGPLGWQSQVVNEADLAQNGWTAIKVMPGDMLVVSKSHQPAVYPHLAEAQARGATILVDFCDNHFDRTDAIGQHQHALLNLADRVIASTPELKTLIQGLTQIPVDCIIDCFEGQKQIPRFAPGATLQLLWFGSHTNFDTLHGLFDELKQLAQHHPVHLELVTLHPQGHEAAQSLCAEGLQVSYTPWSITALPAAFNRCDLVLIPTLQSEHKAGKSANRLVESLWAGRFAITGALPAYTPFAPYAKVGGKLLQDIQWALQHPQEVLQGIADGQQYIIAHHTPKRIGELWHVALQALFLENAYRVTKVTEYHHKMEATALSSKAMIIISHYNQRGTDDLGELLKSIDTYVPGIEIEIAIVVNDVTQRPLPNIKSRYPVHIFYRPNTGMNIGAWDHGWRQFPEHTLFIFLQDECRIIKHDWAKVVASKFADQTLGLVGESMNLKWDYPWATLAQQPQVAPRVATYQAIFQRWAVPTGETGKHLRSLVWAARKETLDAIEGFHVGQTLKECIAAEIAVSKQIEAQGMRIAQLSEARPFQFIAHTEWSTHQRKLTAAAFETKFNYGDTFTLSQKHYTVKPRHDLFALIDHAPLSLCEIGCADGTNLRALASQLQAQGLTPTLVGVDIAKIDNEPAYQDMTFLHQTAESFVSTWQAQRFDLVILSDVIEHLYNPWQFMHQLRRLLNPGARVLMSVPNIQNLNYVHATASGGFHYHATGLFDVTHIRFFSVETLTMLIEQAGYRVVAQDFRPDMGLASLREKTHRNLTTQTETTVEIGAVRLTMNQNSLDRYFSQQILISCTPL